MHLRIYTRSSGTVESLERQLYGSHDTPNLPFATFLVAISWTIPSHICALVKTHRELEPHVFGIIRAKGDVNATPNLSDRADLSIVSEYSRCKNDRTHDFPYRGCPSHDSPSRDCPFSSNHLSVYPAGDVAEVPFEEQQEQPGALLAAVDLAELLALLPCLYPWCLPFLRIQSARPEFGVLQASCSDLLVLSR